ncbi:MAG: hypothetical protein K8J31_20690 [Anaerolineae bacterium]|nr:hypothetical protein [Anaerolineae bacterium]
MATQTVIHNLTDLKPLTTDQYDACKGRAIERLQARIGDKPTRKQFKRDYALLWNLLDLLALVIFLAALAISSLHILAYSGQQATVSYNASSAAAVTGLKVDAHTYGVIHQIGFVLLAEAAMLLFFVLFRTRQRLEKWLALGLAVMAMVFVIAANLSSGLNVFLSILAPAFTIGIGFRLEALTAENLRRNADIDRRYLEALTIWERAQDDLTTHPDYRPLLAQEIWEKLISLKANSEFRDAPQDFKQGAVYRELERDAWAYKLNEHASLQPSFSPIQASRRHDEVAQTNPLSAIANGRNSRQTITQMVGADNGENGAETADDHS